LVLAGQTSVDSENYAHYLHHKYFEVNYTDPLIPLDKWFGTFHDGSAEAQEAMNRRVRKRIRASRR
jgi:sterol desaturase/sphingolipid hydroxylase (fatty acid hydroxylase superfamily)